MVDSVGSALEGDNHATQRCQGKNRCSFSKQHYAASPFQIDVHNLRRVRMVFPIRNIAALSCHLNSEWRPAFQIGLAPPIWNGSRAKRNRCGPDATPCAVPRSAVTEMRPDDIDDMVDDSC